MNFKLWAWLMLKSGVTLSLNREPRPAAEGDGVDDDGIRRRPRGPPARPGTLRPRPRARRLRRWLRGGHQGPPLARHREPGAGGAQEPPAPGRLRLRGQYRRRRGPPGPRAPRPPGAGG